MREYLVNFFRDNTFGPMMGLFNLTHIIVYLLAIGLTIFMALKFYKKDEAVKTKILNIIITIVVCLYFGDFFIHPLMNNDNSLIVDKLPFHLCTSACILIAFGRVFKKELSKIYHATVVLGLVGSFAYITLPTGVNGCYLFCYRSLQTLIYHSLLFMFGVLSLCYQDVKLSIKNIYVEVIFVVIQITISLFANEIYQVSDHHYDWYFTTGSSFNMSSTIMPFIVFGVIIVLCCMVYGIYYLVKYFKIKRIENN